MSKQVIEKLSPATPYENQYVPVDYKGGEEVSAADVNRRAAAQEAAIAKAYASQPTTTGLNSGTDPNAVGE